MKAQFGEHPFPTEWAPLDTLPALRIGRFDTTSGMASGYEAGLEHSIIF